jgi:hypothetical protein
MRPARKRFVRRKQIQTTRRKPMGDGTAVQRYMHNASGRAAMREALGEQRRRQGGLCGKCNIPLPWDEAKFRYKECPDGVVNDAIHKRC